MFVKIHGLQKLKIRLYTKLVSNLKKYLKFITNTVKSDAKAMHHLFLSQKTMIRPQISIFKAFTFLIKP